LSVVVVDGADEPVHDIVDQPVEVTASQIVDVEREPERPFSRCVPRLVIFGPPFAERSDGGIGYRFLVAAIVRVLVCSDAATIDPARAARLLRAVPGDRRTRHNKS